MKPWLTTVAALCLACGGGATQGPGARSSAAPAEEGPPPTDARCGGEAPGAGYECMQTCGPPVHRESDPVPAWEWLSQKDASARKQSGCPK